MTPDPEIDGNEGESDARSVDGSNEVRRQEQMPDGTIPEHLVLVNWDREAERNRASQVLKKYGEDRTVRPQGTIRYVHEDVDTDLLVDDLLERLPAENVHLFEIEELEVSDENLVTDTLVYEFDEQHDDLDNVLNFVITNHRGRLVSPMDRRYEINSQKGRVEVEYEIAEDGSSVTVNLEGPPRAVDHLKESFVESLKQIGGQ